MELSASQLSARPSSLIDMAGFAAAANGWDLGQGSAYPRGHCYDNFLQTHNFGFWMVMAQQIDKTTNDERDFP